MHLVLLQPPTQDFYDTDIRLQPLGLCMLKACVAKYLPQVQVTVRDYHQGYGRRTVALPPALSYLRKYYAYPDRGPFCSFYNYFHFGAAFEFIVRDLQELKPDIVGISSLFSPYHAQAETCARLVKKELNCPVIMGGSHVSALPEQVLQSKNVDFIVRGEGEKPLVCLLEALLTAKSLHQVPGLGWKSAGQLIFNPVADNFSLEELPAADFSDLDGGQYCFEGRPMCFLTTSRGCPHKCSFCSVHLTFGYKYRKRNPNHILQEMKLRYEQGIRVFDFEDDNLSFYRQDFKSLLKAIIESFPQGDICLLAMNGISYLSLDRELLELMRQAGFSQLNLSLVSANQKVLAKLGRPHTVSRFQEVVDMAHELGFFTVAYFILGLPQENLKQVLATMQLLSQEPVLIGASIFYLTPGSPIAGDFDPPGEIDILRARSTAMAVQTDNFKREQIFTLFITARILNFLKGLDLRLQEQSLEDLRTQDWQGRDKVGMELLSRILDEGVLYAVGKKSWQLMPCFDAGLFEQVLKTAGFLTTLTGKKILF